MNKIRCERCEKILNPKNLVWLEYSHTDGNYYKPDEFPKNHISQGIFTFGKDCAKIELKSHL